MTQRTVSADNQIAQLTKAIDKLSFIIENAQKHIDYTEILISILMVLHEIRNKLPEKSSNEYHKITE